MLCCLRACWTLCCVRVTGQLAQPLNSIPNAQLATVYTHILTALSVLAHLHSGFISHILLMHLHTRKTRWAHDVWATMQYTLSSPLWLLQVAGRTES